MKGKLLRLWQCENGNPILLLFLAGAFVGCQFIRNNTTSITLSIILTAIIFIHMLHILEWWWGIITPNDKDGER